MMADDKKFMQRALAKAEESLNAGGFPAGAVIAKGGQIIGEGISISNKLNDPTSHGDIAAIREACAKLQKTDLSGATLYTTLQPCLMCFGASSWSMIGRIVFACATEKVSEDYYGGHYSVVQINADMKQPVELVHLKELEAESLALVHKWEKSLNAA